MDMPLVPKPRYGLILHCLRSENPRKFSAILYFCEYNVSVNNTTLYFIYNKNSTFSGRHVSTFIRSSSGPLGKHIQELAIFQCFLGFQMHCNIDTSWICFPRGSEDDLIKVETYCPDNVLFLLYRVHTKEWCGFKS